MSIFLQAPPERVPEPRPGRGCPTAKHRHATLQTGGEIFSQVVFPLCIFRKMKRTTLTAYNSEYCRSPFNFS